MLRRLPALNALKAFEAAAPHESVTRPAHELYGLDGAASPKLLQGRARLGKRADVLKFPLLHLDDRKDWAKWLEAAGVADAELSHGPVLNRASMVIDAAIDGQGIALARTTLAAWDLINGRLVRPFVETLRLSKTYC